MENLSTENDTCPPSDVYPTTPDFLAGLGGYAIALYVTASLVVGVLLVEYIILVRQFQQFVPGSRRVPTLWINSVYLVVAVATLFCVALPQATDFVWLFYRIYLAMAMGYFVDLTLAWYGGESAMVQQLGEGRMVNYRVRPCCLCLICSKSSPFSKKSIHYLRGAVYQVIISAL